MILSNQKFTENKQSHISSFITANETTFMKIKAMKNHDDHIFVIKHTYIY